MNALIIVDLQNDFVKGGALAVPDGEEVVPVANRMQDQFDLVVGTCDWHPPDHGSFASNHPGRKVGDVIDLAGQPQVLWPEHCVQNSPGAEFVPDLRREGWAAVFQKGTGPTVDSYSGFFDNGKQDATGLEDFLRERGVTAVAVLGLATDYCVKFTVLDAVNLGFKTSLIVDGCRGVELAPGDVDRAIQAMRDAGAEILTAEEIIRNHLKIE